MGMNVFLMSSFKYTCWKAIINLVTISAFGNHISIFLITQKNWYKFKDLKKSEEWKRRN